MTRIVVRELSNDGPELRLPDGWVWTYDPSGERCEGGTTLTECTEPSEYSGRNEMLARQLCRKHFLCMIDESQTND